MKKLFFVLLFCGVSFGDQKYVDFQNVTNGNGSIANPWNVLTSAKTGLGNRDTLNMKGTFYVNKIYYWDPSNKHAYLRAWSKASLSAADSCVFYDTAGTSASDGFAIQDTTVLDGIFFTSTLGNRENTDFLVSIQKGGSTIKNCRFHDFMGTAIQTTTNQNNNLISNDTIYNSWGGHGVLIRSNNNIVRSCKIYDIGLADTGSYAMNDCVFVNGGVSENIVEGCNLASNSQKSDIILVNGIAGTRQINTIVRYNYLHGINNVSGIDVDASDGSTCFLQGLKIYNNVIAVSKKGTRNDSYGSLRFNQSNSDSADNPIRVFNNTIYLSGVDTSSLFVAGINFGTSRLGHIDITNNIVYTNDGSHSNYVYPIFMNNATDTANMTNNNNLLYSTEGRARNNTTFRIGSNNDTLNNPNFINPLTDLGIYTTSPAYQTGADLSAFFTAGILDSPNVSTWPNPDTVTRVDWSMGAIIPHNLIQAPAHGIITGIGMDRVDTVWYGDMLAIIDSAKTDTLYTTIPAQLIPGIYYIRTHSLCDFRDTLFNAIEYSNIYGIAVAPTTNLDTAGGDTVRFASRYGLTGATLLFDGSPVLVTVVSDSSAYFIAPAHARGAVSGTLVASLQAFEFTVRYGSNKLLTKIKNFFKMEN